MRCSVAALLGFVRNVVNFGQLVRCAAGLRSNRPLLMLLKTHSVICAASAVTFPSPLLVTVTVAFVPAGSFSDGTVISVVVSFLISSEGLVSVVVLPLLDELPLDEFFFKTTVPPSTAAGMVTSTLPLFTVYDVPEYRSFKIVPLF